MASPQSRPIRLCFVSLQARAAFVPEAGKPIGGAEMQIRHLSRHLARRSDFEIHVIVGDDSQPDRELVDGVTLHRLAQPPRRADPLGALHRRWQSFLGLRRLLTSIHADAYVLMAAGPEAGIIAHTARRLGARFVYLVASDKECEPKNPWSAGLAGWLWRRGVRQADPIIVQNASQLPGIRRVFDRDALVLPSVHPFGPEPAGARQGVLWVGRCVALKQPLLFVELARRLPEYPFTMIALPVQRELESFRQLETAARLPNLALIPGVAHDRVADYFKRHAVFVNTSEYEGLPNTFIESADHGVAVVSLNVDPNGIFKNQGVGICCGGSMDRLVEAVRNLLENESARRRFVESARADYMANHSVEIVAARFAAILKRLGHSGPSK